VNFGILPLALALTVTTPTASAKPSEYVEVHDLIYTKCQVEFGKSKAQEKASYYAPMVIKAAHRYRLDSSLVAAVTWHESNYYPRCVSPAGALGLMQVMPFHFRRGEVWSDPQTNLNVGCRILGGYVHRAAGDVGWALMMYNAGPAGASRGWGRRYARAVMRSAR
jgi:soluble lytic murein transglycosylase-like protein